ncbi:hypothetical protein AABB24_007892 [Solanum stoloniferum]|uniref:Uncharacterized protein n=1 Tax=Solanum stoloniferum TaxID=62892 RepID=A0ABD2UQH4_9SOLN
MKIQLLSQRSKKTREVVSNWWSKNVADKLKKKMNVLKKWCGKNLKRNAKTETKIKKKKPIKLRRGRSGVWVANWNKKKIECMDVMGNESRKARTRMWLQQTEQEEEEETDEN